MYLDFLFDEVRRFVEKNEQKKSNKYLEHLRGAK